MEASCDCETSVKSIFPARKTQFEILLRPKFGWFVYLRDKQRQLQEALESLHLLILNF